jgi:23S rRNA (cytidine1920-2'-O)/16S rRNA (cytidine1409-2'-O)-methyltransferase
MKQRLDRLLVEQKLAPSREKAQAFVMAGIVRVDGQPAGKSGRMISTDSLLEVLGTDQPFVSRGGVKLKAALEYFEIEPKSLVALDIGSSTGGFTHCLLLGGAEKVFAVDVGYGQLAWELRQDPRVNSLERTNIRYLEFEKLGEYVDLVVIDVSFISLRLIFPKALEFLKPGGSLVALVKPQFEAGVDDVGKRGKVSDTAVHEKVLETLKVEAKTQGFIVLGQTKSSIVGKKSGNEEFFLWLQKPQNSDSNQS